MFIITGNSNWAIYYNFSNLGNKNKIFFIEVLTLANKTTQIILSNFKWVEILHALVYKLF